MEYGNTGGGGGYFADGGGGGFMGGSPAGGGGGYGSQLYGDGGGQGGFADNASPGGGGGGGGAKPNRERQTCIPVSIQQIHQAGKEQAHPDGKFVIDGADLYQVKIVGFIREVSAHSTSTAYIVEDGSGLIECRLFHDNNESEQENERRERLVVYTVVRVFGTVRHFESKVTLNISDIRPVDDFNEITYHGLSVIHTHLLRTKGPIGGAAASPAGRQAAGGAAGFRQPQFGSPGAMQQPQFNGGGGGGMQTFTAKQQLVLDCFVGVTSETGVNVDAVAQKLQGQVTQTEVKQITAFLSGEGHIYSTIDEMHFKSTTS